MATRMLSVRIDSETLESVKARAAERGMTMQEFVVTTLRRTEFEDRFQQAFAQTLALYGGVLADAADGASTDGTSTDGTPPDGAPPDGAPPGGSPSDAPPDAPDGRSALT
ncbi:hypothetical protein [Streptomyces sp. NPDC003077]|uniref:hypothetical protein n=1 Tax=Streptomyces sp. NPDC003077 TaxID=3154443 RepID=UPI0033BF3EBD